MRAGADSSSAFPENCRCEDLESVAREYFSQQWRSSYFEKVLCEAFISLEACLYARHIKLSITSRANNRAADTSLNSLFDDLSDENIARKNNYNMDKMDKAFVKRAFIHLGRRLALFVGLPILATGLIYILIEEWSGVAAVIALGIVAMYISYHLITCILQLAFAGIRKGLRIETKETDWDKSRELYIRMAETYLALSKGGALPHHLLTMAEKDHDEGVQYNSMMYSILLRASDDKNYLWGSETSEV